MKRTTWLAALVAFMAVTALFQDAFARSRMYHPSLGRFMQRDVLGYVDGMSLYQYAGSRPIVATDPMGGCSAKQKKEWLETNCFCVTDMQIIGGKDPDTRSAQANITVKITGEWKANTTGKCGLPGIEWWEWYTLTPNVKYYKNLAPRTWHEMYDVVVNKFGDENHQTFKEVTPTYAEKKNVYRLKDSPGIGVSVANIDAKQLSYFAFRATSTPGCPCDNARITRYATHSYTTHKGDIISGGVSENEFDKLGVLPNPPGPPPWKNWPTPVTQKANNK